MNHAINRVNVISTLSGIIAIGFALIFSNVLSAANRSYTSAEDCNFGVATAQNFEGATGDTVSIIVPEAGECTSLIVSGVLLSDPEADVKQWTSRGGEVTLASTGTQAGPNGSEYTYTLVPDSDRLYNIEVRVALNGTPSAPAAIKIGDGTTYHQWSWQSSTQSSGPSGGSSSSSGTPATPVPALPLFGLLTLGGLLGVFGLRKLKK